MAKDFPFTNNISIAVLKMQETGQLEDLKRKWWDERNKCPLVKQLTSAGGLRYLYIYPCNDDVY
jgi:hypothetical protein